MNNGELESGRAAPARAQATRDRQIIESITEFAIIVTDRRGIITEWNPGAEQILGWTADEMIGQSAEAFFIPEDRANGQIDREMLLSLKTGRGVDERWHLRKGGVLFWASGEMMPLHAEDGAHIGFVKVLRDRTDQHIQGEKLDVSRRDLAASEAKWRGLFETLQEGFILGRVIRDETDRVVDWRYEEVNPAWGELVGIPSHIAAGQTIRELFPDIEDEWIQEFASVVDTGKPIQFTRQVGNLGRWYDGRCQPLGQDRFVVLFMEATNRVLEQKRQSGLLALGDQLRNLSRPEDIALAACAMMADVLGVDLVGYGDVDPLAETITIERDWTAAGVPSLAGTLHFRTFGTYIEDLKRGDTVVVRDCKTDPRTRDFAEALKGIHVQALVNTPIIERGEFVALSYVCADQPRNWTDEELAFIREVGDRVRVATERARSEIALRESQSQLLLERSLLQAVIQQAPLGISIVYADGHGEINNRLQDMLGHGAEGIGDERYRKFSAVHADGRPYAIEDYPTIRALRTGQTITDELMIYRNAQTQTARRWEVSSTPVRDAEGVTLAAVTIAIDVEDQWQADEQRTILNRELSHRLKNTLAIVQSIAGQTLRMAPDLTTARQTLSQRIQALSKAHDILVTGQSDAGSLEVIIQNALEIHNADARIALRGPVLDIGPKAALSVALIMHELATNAAKYGALSVPEGRVHVAWVVETADDEGQSRPTLVLQWRELHGPPVSPPTKKSFGTRLIEMGLSGATGGAVDIDYDPAGLICRIKASLTELQANDD